MFTSNGKKLFNAVVDGDLNAVKKYVKKKSIDLEFTDHAGDTPLTEAVRKNNVDIVICLLEHGVNINHQNDHGNTGLHLAASCYKNITKLLINAGARIDIKNKSNRTALHDASIVDDKPIAVEALLSVATKSDLKEKSYFGKTAFLLASEHGSIEILNAVIKASKRLFDDDKYKLDSDNYGKNVLCMAVLYSKGVEKVDLLLDIGIHIDSTDNHSNTPLLLAIKNNNIEKAYKLISRGANVNHKNNAGDTTLKEAIKLNDIKLIQTLIDAGVSFEKSFEKDSDLSVFLANNKSIKPKIIEFFKSKKEQQFLEDNGGWIKINNDKIAYKEVEESINREITQIFNLKTMTVKETTRNIDTNAESSIKYHFSDKAADKSLIIKAAKEHQKNNGSVNMSDVKNALNGINPIRVLTNRKTS